EQLMGNVWNQEVDRVIMEQQYKALGIVVTPKELSELMFDEQLSPLKREFTDPKTGQFKAAEARTAFENIKKSKNAEQIELINNAYIEPTVQQTLRVKYSNLIQQSAYIPKWLVEKQIADNNAVASIDYVGVPYSTIQDSTVKVTDEDVKAYAQKHAKEFQKEDETRTVSFVSFSALPSAADSLNALNLIAGLSGEFAATADVKAFLGRVGTEMPYYESYFSKSRLQQPNKDSLVRLQVGEVFGPYIDGNNYVYAKMIGVKQWPDSAKVRHILVSTGNPQTGQVVRQDSVAKKLIDSLETAIKGGASFDELCAKYSDDPGSKDKGGVYDFFPQGQMVGAFNEYAFDKPVGSKGVVKTEFGYHYMEVLGQKNVQPAYKLAYLAKPIVASNETVNAASTSAAQFASVAKNKQLFEENVVKQGLNNAVSGEIKENDFSISGIGQNRQLVRWVFENKEGAISEPFEVDDKFVVAMVNGISKPGLPSVTVLRPQVEFLIKNEKKAQKILNEKFKGTSLEDFAKSSGFAVAKADSVLFSNPFIPGIGTENKIIGAAFNSSLVNKVSAPIAGSNGVYAIKVNAIGAKTLSDVEAVKQQLLQMQRMAGYRGGDALRKAATVKDYRSKFY
ncbi:MAG: peptidylprolyl isomerase, partial [Chitinophagaceae bacterium]